MRVGLKLPLIAATIAVLSSCGGSSDSDNSLSQSTLEEKCTKDSLHSYWYDTLALEYLWLDELSIPNKAFANYTDTNELLEDVVAAGDRFSYAIPTDRWEETITGSGLDYGVEFGPVNGELIVYQVYQNSPADVAGLKRGDKITKIGMVAATTVVDWLSEPYQLTEFFDLLGPDTQGYSLRFSWTTPQNIEFSQLIQKEKITINTVALAKVISTNAGNVAYLSFPTGFFENSADEIDNAFSYFKNQNIDHFVLDLRDNGGGLLSVAARLSLYLAGDKLDGEVFLNITHNQNLASLDADFTVEDLINSEKGASYNQILSNSLNLNELVVLTNGRSASASESVINGLNPYLNLTQIGQDTYGKPVGFYANKGEQDGYDICNQTLLAVNFQTENSLGFADYLNGLEAGCEVSSDYPAGDWAQLADPAQSAALYYLENGECKPSTAAKALTAPANSKVYQPITIPGMLLAP